MADSARRGSEKDKDKRTKVGPITGFIFFQKMTEKWRLLSNIAQAAAA